MRVFSYEDEQIGIDIIGDWFGLIIYFVAQACALASMTTASHVVLFSAIVLELYMH